jgi:hypothetical protein
VSSVCLYEYDPATKSYGLLVDNSVVDSVMTSKWSARYAVLFTGTRTAAYVRNFKTVLSASRV